MAVDDENSQPVLALPGDWVQGFGFRFRMFQVKVLRAGPGGLLGFQVYVSSYAASAREA